MNVAFYTDKKDVFKWSWALHESSRRAITHVHHVAMVTAPRPNQTRTSEPHWHYPARPATADSVLSFFSEENAAISRGAPPDLGRVSALGATRGLSITVDVRPYALASADAYFDRVVDQVRAAGRASVLLDPDNGLAPPKAPNDQHLRVCDAGRVFDALAPGSLLMVVQDMRHDTTWIEDTLGALAGAGLPLLSGERGLEQVRIKGQGKPLFAVFLFDKPSQ